MNLKRSTGAAMTRKRTQTTGNAVSDAAQDGVDGTEAADRAGVTFVLKLYIASLTPRSMAAIRSVKEVCEKHLHDRYELEIIDIYEHPSQARGEQIVAAPTLIKKLPLPLRRLIGDMANEERVLVGLDLRTRDDGTNAPV
jgi:circadian clock protein KaiB